MPFCASIAAKVLVWLAAVLVPVDALPMLGCACGGSQRDCGGNEQPERVVAGECPHCAAEAQSERSCCCGANCGDCGCGAGAPGAVCHCASNPSAPTPAPVSSDSGSSNHKSAQNSSLQSASTTVVVSPPAVLAHPASQPALLGTTALDRLSVLCRLVI